MGVEDLPRAGIALPSCGDRRSSTEFAKAVIADSVRGYDADFAQSVETSRNWIADYVAAFRTMTAVSATSPAASLGIARAGLASARTLLRFVDTGDVETSLGDGSWRNAEGAFGVETVHGRSEAVTALRVPVDGVELEGDSLRRKLIDWRDRGIVEPGFVEAIEKVIDNPEWLALPGYQVVALGAAAEIGPYLPLTTWGADVFAVDLPDKRRWQKLLEDARAGAGKVSYPVDRSGPGADVTQDFPRILKWILANTSKRNNVVLGMYANTHGRAHVALTAAADVIAEDVLANRPGTVLAYLASPTDCYAVKADVVADARRRWRDRGVRGYVQNALRVASRSAMFRPNYDDEVVDGDGERWGIANALLPVQGPSFALAKRMQRWRAAAARADGEAVSYSVAPASWTRSVTSNTVLAAAYHGSSRFGVEIFEPETTRVLMAAKLVSDIFAPVAVDANANPEELLYQGAAHNGLWRQPFEPLSALNIAAASGYARALFDR